MPEIVRHELRFPGIASHGQASRTLQFSKLTIEVPLLNWMPVVVRKTRSSSDIGQRERISALRSIPLSRLTIQSNDEGAHSLGLVDRCSYQEAGACWKTRSAFQTVSPRFFAFSLATEDAAQLGSLTTTH